VLADVHEDNYAFKEEIFGPVLAVIKANVRTSCSLNNPLKFLFLFQDENDAIRLANQNQFALGAGVFTKDIAKVLVYFPCRPSSRSSVAKALRITYM
jgi:acyl-CoA reductase-like NAD-dependent aldehyde dehydrogenase